MPRFRLSLRLTFCVLGLVLPTLAVAYNLVVQSVTVRLQAPTSPSLLQMDSNVDTSFVPVEIPYATLEPQIEQLMQGFIAQNGSDSGVYVCTDPCPDVTWSFNTTLDDFKITKPGQPEITGLGGANGQPNQVEVKVLTQLWARLGIKIHAETWGPVIDVKLSIPVFVTVLAKVKMTTFPSWQIQGSPQFWTGTTMYLPDEPPLLKQIGAFDKMGFEAKIAMLKDQIGATVENQMSTLLPALLGGGIDIESQILSTAIPGGGTVADVQALLGMTLDARTQDTNLGATLTVTTRFSPSGFGGTISGIVRFPKEQCGHVIKNSYLLGYMKLPTGFTETNTDLAGYVGQPCSSAPLPSDGVVADLFRGMTPPTTSLPMWNEVGSFSYVGTLTDAGTEGYYECGFELDVPNGFLALSNEMEGRVQPEDLLEPTQDRYLMLAGSLFDRNWAPQAAGQLVIGGAGYCSSSKSGGGLHENPALEKLKEFDPENCWACGPMLHNVIDQKARPIDLRKPGFASKIQLQTMAPSMRKSMGAQIPAAAAPAKGQPMANAAKVEVIAPARAQAPAQKMAPVEAFAPAGARMGTQLQSQALGAIKGIENSTAH